MRRFGVRFTIRTLLIAVAVFALLLEGEAVRRRWAYARQMASIHAEAERAQRFLLDGGVVIGRDDRGRPTPHAVRRPFTQLSDMGDGVVGGSFGWIGDLDRVSVERQADYHAAQKSRYQRASSHPWIAVPPEPPGLDRAEGTSAQRSDGPA